ncbi:MAG TPA: efflux RND transporter periplasmic adaptor subunit, partial [Xanthomonadales bacterium]|nr:efflux RND transporter periplasmic adaptor subunit [Xanthomonadales bacterium]
MKWVIPTLCLLLCACGNPDEEEVETLRIKRGEFLIPLQTQGELRAAESTPIMPPQGSRNPRTIQWLAPDNSWVTAGEVVARFDISAAEREASSVGIEVDKVDLQVVGKQRELERLLGELGNQMELVDIEKVMADEFAIDNELAYSRFEIIDAMRNKELLDYRSGHLEDKKDNYSDRQGAEVAVLEAQRATQESKLQEQHTLLETQLVKAPHDGYFVLEKNWFGQHADVGSTVFAGSKFASIPNLQKMEAVLNVLETEAVGLAVGQSAQVIIDAFPERVLNGKLSSISATAAPIERDSPVKYFTVVVTLEEADPEWIKAGSIVRAEIFINQLVDTIVIPNQAVFQKDSNNWVLLQQGNELVQRTVKLGMR